MWYKLFLTYYGIMAFSLSLHELAHFLTAKFLRMRNLDFYLGAPLLQIKIRRFHLSPFLFMGSVEMDGDEILKQSNVSIFILFMSGPFINSVLLLISLIMGPSIIQNALLVISLGFIVSSLFPLLVKNNDFASLVQYLRVKKYQLSLISTENISKKEDKHDVQKEDL